MILQIISAALGVWTSAIVFEAPKHLLKYISVIGAVGWSIYLLFNGIVGSNFATYFSGLVVATLSHICARIFKAPVTVFFIPGFFPLVPGAGMFQTVYWYISGDITQGQYYLTATLATAGMIAMAIFTIDSIFNGYSRVQQLIKKRNLR